MHVYIIMYFAVFDIKYNSYNKRLSLDSRLFNYNVAYNRGYIYIYIAMGQTTVQSVKKVNIQDDSLS